MREGGTAGKKDKEMKGEGERYKEELQDGGGRLVGHK